MQCFTRIVHTKKERKKAVESYKSVKGISVFNDMTKRLNELIKMDLWAAVNRDNLEERHEFPAKDYDDAKHWAINHLDLSKTWTIYNITDE